MIFGTRLRREPGRPEARDRFATGPSSVRKAQARPPLGVVQQPMQQGLRSGTDNLPILNTVAQPNPSVNAAQTHSCEGLNTPSVWRSARSQAVAKVEALSSNGMDEIEVPAFLRKQAN